MSHDDDRWAEGDDDIVIRPYLLTRGRTHGAIAVEALVSTKRSMAELRQLDDEHRLIAELSNEPVGVAELAARLRIPLGVARVLIADLIENGWLELHESAGSDPEIELVEAILAGLRDT